MLKKFIVCISCIRKGAYMYENIIFYFLMPILAYVIPLIVVLRKGRGDCRFYFRKIIFPIHYLEQRAFEKMFHNIRVACRVGHIMLLVINMGLLMTIPATLTGNNNANGPEYLMNKYPYYFFIIVLFSWLGLISYLFQPEKGKEYRTK